MAIRMQLKDGTRYLLADDGAVIDRSDGPHPWNYSGSWIILGFLRRWNSTRVIPLCAALEGEDVGHGYIVDLDHGTRRVWAAPSGRRLSGLFSRGVSETERA